MSGWIGVDFDGTLAHYEGWNGGELGAPVKAMQNRVLDWLNNGREVRVVTARVAVTGLRNQVGELDDQTFADEQRGKIEAWCKQHLGRVIPITATKDFGMVELWDDRCVRVVANTGEPCCENHRTR
jgi:hypothetical protein